MSRILNALALTFLVPAALAAQHPQTRNGFGISFGLGAGSATLTCDGCSDDGGSGTTGYLRLGGYLTPSLFLAGETNGWTGNDLSSIGAIMGVVQWYPMMEKGLYLKGGVGYTYSTLGDFYEFTTSGIGASIGAGYDWRVARNFALTPFVNYLTQIGGTLSSSDGTAPDASPEVHVLQFGLGFTWF